MDTIKKQLELLFALALFLPVVFDAIFEKAELSAGNVTLTWGIVIAFLILNYLLLNIDYFNLRNRFQEVFTKSLLLLTIFSFVPVLLMTGMDKDGIIYFPWTTILYGSLVFLYISPLLIFIELALYPLFFDAYVGWKEDVKTGTYKKLWNLLLKRFER